MLRGVMAVVPGYAGGIKDAPNYHEVSSGKTGHAEVIKIEYNPAQISYETLLIVFFATHDPTTRNRQGADVGTQYRSVIFYTDGAQKIAAEKMVGDLNASSTIGAPIVTEVAPFEKFFEAENYHRDYYAQNKDQPYCQVVINPKLEKVRKKFAELLK